MPILIPAPDVPTPPVVGQPQWVSGFLTTSTGFTFDISKFLATVDITGGRNSAYEASVSAAQCSLTLDDANGTFDPDNTASPLYGKLTVGPQSTTTLRVGTYVPELNGYAAMFTGYLDSLERSFTGGDYSETQVTAVDQTAELTRHIPQAGTILPQELTGARINRLLNMTSRSGFRWASRSLVAPLAIDRGQKILGAYTCDGTTSSWDIAQGAAASEGGLLFFSGDGTLRFHGQQRRLVSNPQWRFSDAPFAGIIYESDLTFRLSTDDVIVDAAVTTQDGVTWVWGPGGGHRETDETKFPTQADVTETSQLAGNITGRSRAEYLYVSRSKARRNAPQITVNWAPLVGQWTY